MTDTPWPFGRQTPEPCLMRFVSKLFPLSTTFLDIGSGEGANARELRLRGHKVLTIDKNPEVKADIQQDIAEWKPIGMTFDLIYDVNTLCHIQIPPFKKIKSWLNPDGVLFSICPQFGSSSRVMQGKEHTKFLTLKGAQEYSDGVFSSIKVGSATYRLPGEEMYASWLIEARP